MNQTDFTYILQHPQAIAHQQTDAIKSIIDEFPYFQSARAVYLKGLKNQSSFKYNQELKTTAAYTTDRSILFDYITSDEFVQNEISQFIKKNTSHLKDIDVDIEDISINKSVTIDDALRQQIKDTDGVLDPALFEAKEKRLSSNAFVLDESESIETVTEETKTQDVSASEILSLGKPLQFEKKETHSFNEWLKITSFKPIIREEIEEPLKIVKTKKTSTSKDKVKKFELIDKFITQNPKINPKKSTSSKGNLAKAQMIQPESLMTETLARIYVEQKNYKKAIQSYRILSLKYPEKSSFFANQIKAVEQLQEHNNKE
ncbi:hypothetical protein [Thalassobellus suaedae]|uniref:Tetratricopeptide repeat protein n=1 Tax=Thalassobellus suaedae TaxID=3074124 RepID=A0ABY9XZ26_9FLAO|nr:hypothetical protein RHP49_09365 [Flavobacteriaceae bacterium HL-DH10]